MSNLSSSESSIFENGVLICNFIFQVDELVVKTSDSEGTPDNVREECCPGVPYIVFYVRPGVTVSFVNPQPHAGFFSHVLVVRDGDTVDKVTAQLRRVSRNLKGKQILFRVILNCLQYPSNVFRWFV